MNVDRWAAAGRGALIGLGLWVLGACSGNNGPVEAVGLLEWDRIELTAEADEPIIALEVREGDAVKSGQVLLRLDPQRAQARVDAARAARDQSAARLAELERGPRAERIRAARAKLAGAESALETAVRELQRRQSLRKQKLVSPQDVDRAREQRDAAQAARDAARAELDEALAGSTAEELDQARQALLRAEAELRTQQVALDRLTVHAPQDGRVDALPFELGERPKPGAVVAVMLGGAAPYARVYVPEQARANIAPGHAAKVFVDGITEPFEARVRNISDDPAFTPYYSLTESDRSRLSYVAEIELQGKGIEKLPSGVPVRVEFPANDR